MIPTVPSGCLQIQPNKFPGDFQDTHSLICSCGTMYKQYTITHNYLQLSNRLSCWQSLNIENAGLLRWKCKNPRLSNWNCRISIAFVHPGRIISMLGLVGNLGSSTETNQLGLLLLLQPFTTLCLGLPRWVGSRRINHSGLCWSRDDVVAVASAEPCKLFATSLQKITMPAPHQSDFYGTDALSDTQPTASKHRRQ